MLCSRAGYRSQTGLVHTADPGRRRWGDRDGRVGGSGGARRERRVPRRNGAGGHRTAGRSAGPGRLPAHRRFAREGEARVAWWLELGRRHYEGMGGGRPRPRSHPDSGRRPGAGPAAGRGGAHLPLGGRPPSPGRHLAGLARLGGRGQPVAPRGGPGRLLGRSHGPHRRCPAGAGAGREPALRARGARGRGGRPGPDRAVGRHPPFRSARADTAGDRGPLLERKPPAATLVGVEEETALVGDGGGWQVQGAGAVWVFAGESPEKFVAGDAVGLAPVGSGPG